MSEGSGCELRWAGHLRTKIGRWGRPSRWHSNPLATKVVGSRTPFRPTLPLPVSFSPCGASSWLRTYALPPGRTPDASPRRRDSCESGLVRCEGAGLWIRADRGNFWRVCRLERPSVWWTCHSSRVWRREEQGALGKVLYLKRPLTYFAETFCQSQPAATQVE